MIEDIKHLKELCFNRSVLYVEDENELRYALGEYLKKFFDTVTLAVDGVDGLEKYNKDSFDLVMTDISMPRKDGMTMAKEIKEINPEQELLVVSAYSESQYFLDAINLGVDGFILKPVDFGQLNLELLKIMTKIEMMYELEAYHSSLEIIVKEKTEREHVLELEKIKNQKKVMISMIELIEKRDSYTAGHSLRVANYCRIIAEKMGYAKSQCDLIYEAGILHDIGKIGIPDTVLLKPGKFNELEYRLIKQHVDVGVDVLIKIPMYKEMVNIIAHHHERYDGRGYPRGVKGDDIPRLARIMIVADAFDAMTTDRVYKGRKTVNEAIDELQKLSGIQFHAEVVDVVSSALGYIKIDDDINQMPKSELEKERFAYFYKDQITGAYNQTYLENVLMECKLGHKGCALYVVNLHKMGPYNKKYGWNRGDELLAEVSSFLHNEYKSTILFRVHGDRFVLVKHIQPEISLEAFSDTEFLNKHEVGMEMNQLYTGLVDDVNIHDLISKIYN